MSEIHYSKIIGQTNKAFNNKNNPSKAKKIGHSYC